MRKMMSAVMVALIAGSGAVRAEGLADKSGAGASGAGGVAPVKLRCENLVDPQGIDVEKPRMSWVMGGSDQCSVISNQNSEIGNSAICNLKSEITRGVTQVAYQVLVASSEKLLAEDKGDVWDTGKVESDKSIHVVYEGKPLVSRMRCCWKVKVWFSKLETGNSKLGESVWSESAFWTMGLLKDEDWKARWIGLAERPVDANKKVVKDGRLPARYLRKEFTVGKKISQATMYVCGLGYHELFINGKRVGDHVLDSILRDYSKQLPYVTHDVTGLLANGANVLGVALGNGRFWGPRFKKQFNYNPPCLRLQMEIVYDDHTIECIGSDNSWRITDRGPIRANNDFDGEDYDARMEIGNWNNSGCDTSAWRAAEIMNAPTGTLTSAALMEPMRVTGTIKPVKLSEPKPGTWVFDMGQNMVGRCRLSVTGVAGTTVKMHFAENVYTNGMIDFRNLRSAKCTDTYILKGGAEESYTPAFTYHGFRYVEVTGFPGKPTLDTLLGQVINTAMPFLGDFQCSDPTLTQILKNARWGIRGNYLSIPTDCPQRDERQGWQGDRAGAQLGEAYLFGNMPLYEKWMGDIRDSQLDDGRLSHVCPNYWAMYGDNVTWPACFVIVPGNIYRHYGDMRAIEQNYPQMERWINRLRQFVVKGIISKDSYGDWCCPPESKDLIHSKQEWRKTPKEVLATSYYYYVLTLMAEYAELQGKASDVQKYRAEAEEIKAAFNRDLYKPEGFYGNGSQTSQVLPLRFGLVPSDRRQAIFDYLANHIETKSGGSIGTGLIGGQWLMRTLSDNGRIDLAYRLATRREYPSWGYMIDNNATTIWELWNGNTANPAMNSGNHVMLLGDLVIWMFEYLGGIQSDLAQPGFKHIIMKPNIVGDLTFARAEHDSPYGLIKSDWKLDGKAFKWSITVPPNTTATVYVPAVEAATVTESGNAIEKAEGVKFLSAEKGKAAVYQVGAGNYSFESVWK
jgi:alpha-L-rhamnosidase